MAAYNMADGLETACNIWSAHYTPCRQDEIPERAIRIPYVVLMHLALHTPSNRVLKGRGHILHAGMHADKMDLSAVFTQIGPRVSGKFRAQVCSLPNTVKLSNLLRFNLKISSHNMKWLFSITITTSFWEERPMITCGKMRRNNQPPICTNVR